MNNGPYIPERGAGLTPQDFPNLPSGPALGFNSCSLCGHGGTSGSILARIREYVTFYANSDADLSDDMAIGRQEVSKSVMEILNEAEPVPAEFRMTVAEWQAFDEDRAPVPAPRLEWEEENFGWSASHFQIEYWMAGERKFVSLAMDYPFPDEDVLAAKLLAEKLNAVLSPPVDQPKEKK